MAFTPITVSRRYLTAELTPATGSVRLTPTAPMVNGDTVVAAGRVGTLDAEGDLTLVVAANNDTSTTPPGVNYEVREDITGQPIRVYHVVIPYDAAGGAVDLSTLTPAFVPPVATYPVAGPQGPQGLSGTPAGRQALLTQAEYLRAVSASQVAAADALSFVESWTNVAAWTAGLTATGSGTAYGGGGANHAFALTSTQQLRATAVLNCSGGSGSTEWIMFGVTSDAAGGTWNLGAFRGIGYETSSGNIVYWTGAAFTVLAAAAPSGTYVATITADSEVIGFSLTSVDLVRDYHVALTRSGFTINNVSVFDNDSRTSPRSTLGPVTARRAHVTTTPPAGAEALYPTSTWGDTGGPLSSALRIVLPPGYDSRRATPLAMIFHGQGGTAATHGGIEAALLGAGYAIVTADGGGTSLAGSADTVAEYARVYAYCRDRLPMGALVMVAESMGGLAALNLIAQRAVPAPAAVVAYSPATNLRALYDLSTDNAAVIRTAYGIASDGSDYTTKTAGYDPNLRAAEAFSGVPMLAFHSPADTVVPKATSTDLLIPRVTPAAAEATLVTTSGDHGDVSAVSVDNLALMQAFLRRWVRA